MKRFLIGTCAAIAMLGMPAIQAAAQTAEPYPMEYWAVRSQISNVALSPDGKQLAFMKIASRDGNPVIEVRDVDDLMGKPHTIGGKSMEITDFFWAGDEDLIVSFRDQVSKNIDGFNQGAYKGKTAYYNTKTKKFTDLSEENSRNFRTVQFINALPEEPGIILVRSIEFKGGRGGDFTTDYVKLDLSSGRKDLVLKGDSKYSDIRFDHLGNPRFASSREGNSAVYYYRPVGQSGWKEYHRRDLTEFGVFNYGGIVKDNPNQIYVTANNGHDRAGLWKYNLNTKSFGEMIHRDPVVDVFGTVRHSNTWSNPGEVTGVRTFKDTLHTKYFDPEEERIIKRFEQSVPNAGVVFISSRSRDGKIMVVENRSPRDPGTFYLYDANSQKFMKIGSVNGLLKAKDLADVEYITYKSRDGKTIPAFLTVPNSPGPHKLVVMPHGGPFVRETVIYDEWSQMLANNGYMVMQPQYRGSKGYGIDFYKTAFMDGGEGGLKMQDDKDDGVKYLISQGRVSKDKVAFFGWSYGGYAALIAAARTPNLYQCSIAGAAVADNAQQLNYYREFLNSERASDIEQIKFWTESINPIKEVENVNIPLMVIHGSIDQRVPIRHAKKYVDELEDNNIPHKYIKLKDADHFSNTLFYDHKMEFYPAMIEFLKNDCGM